MRSTPLSADLRAATILLLAAAALAAALAVPAAAAASALDTLSIALMYESSVSEDPTLVISARLPDDTPLPAEMVLPIPENGNVLYAAEFFPAGDRENLALAPVVEVRDGVPVAVLALTESRIGLIDVAFRDSRTLIQALGNVYETGFDLILPVDVQNVYAAVALPPDIEALESSEVVALSDEPDGNRYHAIERTDASAGDRITLTMQVQETADDERVDETVPWMVIAVVAVIIGAVVLLLITRRRTPATTDDES